MRDLMIDVALLGLVSVCAFALGLLWGLGQTIRILRELRDQLPPDQGVARAVIGELISRLEAHR